MDQNLIVPEFLIYLENYKLNNNNKITNESKINLNEILGKRIGINSTNISELKIIFTLKSGIIFTNLGFVITENLTGKHDSLKKWTTIYSYEFLQNITITPLSIFKNSWSKIIHETEIIGELVSYTMSFEKEVFDDFKKKYIELKDKYIIELEKLKIEKEKKRLIDLEKSQNLILLELDKDGNGEVDVIESNDFNTLLKKYQKNIIEIDRKYIQQFVKISSYLKTKKENIQSIFLSIKDTPNQKVLNEYVEILKDDIHSYNLILFNSLNMIVFLVEDDMITFYEIYEMFDKLNMFDSKHENDISQKLTNIEDGLEDLMDEVRRMGNKISNSIDHLSYVTEESNRQLQDQLSEIDSTLKIGNLISVINTYQNYKINKNTKSIK